jgi:FK506-binding protein 2
MAPRLYQAAAFWLLCLVVATAVSAAFLPSAQSSTGTNQKRPWRTISVATRRSSHDREEEQLELPNTNRRRQCQDDRRGFLAAVAVSLSWIQTRQPSSAVLASDEITVEFAISDLRQGLGLELADMEFQTNLRVVVQSVAPNSIAAKAGIQSNWIVVALNDKSMERTNAMGVKQYLKESIETSTSGSPGRGRGGSIRFIFRDPTLFQSKLADLSSESGPVTTVVAPAGDTTHRLADGRVKPGSVATSRAEDQRVTVEQLEAPRLCNRGASVDDLLEISYTGSVVETGQIFDGSSISINGKELPGRGSDTTLYFVLGKQPFGQFPASWDVGLTGMCVGERRRLTVPPVLGYGSSGLPRRKIPPNATLQYDISLISINGLATPQ